MSHFTRILAATDLSAPARHAAARAARLAAETGARLDLLHVMESRWLTELDTLFAEEAPDLEARLADQAREALSRLAVEVGEPLGVSPGVQARAGALLEAIVEQADALAADLVVVGARGANYLRRAVLGATATRLVRVLRPPVLLVRQVPRETYRSVVVPVDFSRASPQVLRLARAIAPTARLTLLHAYELPFENSMRLAGVEEERIQLQRMAMHRKAHDGLHRLAAEQGLAYGAYHTHVAHGDATARILEQEEEQDADLIVMGKHGNGMLEDMLLGSITKHVLNEADCDVLVTRA